ncbi:MAG: IS481 family transposase [Planctomycetota bacterium]
MKLHANAKTTPSTRALIARRYLIDGWDIASIADSAGVSVRTAWKWIARFRAEGRAGLEDRSSRPSEIPTKTPKRKERRIEKLRRRRLTAHQIAGLTSIPRSTVSAILVRLGLNRLRDLLPKEPIRRYERDAPGDLLHFDVKKLGRFRGIGKRFKPRQEATRTTGIGWEFVHVCIDDHSRVAYAEILEDERKETAIGFLERAVDWFAHLGVRTKRILTDNGSCYVARDFDEACDELGIEHRTTRPYRPQTNGKAERFIQTILREWAYAKPYSSSGRRRMALQPWLRYYNRTRLHGGIAFQPPMTRIQGTE